VKTAVGVAAATPDVVAAATTPTSAAGTPPNVAAPASAVEVERSAIRQVLERYRIAIDSLDANATRNAWPGVNQRALARAFERLVEQDVSFQQCRISANSTDASAVCGGVVRYVPRIGRRTQQVEQREWTFHLRRAANEWLIEDVVTR
jgi:hypothetical protein